MELVRYKPGEAIRWIQTGAEDIRRSAKRQGTGLVRREGHRTLGKDLSQAAGALLEMGKSAYAQLLHRQASAIEYVLGDDAFDVVGPTGTRTIRYQDVKDIQMDGERLTVILAKGSVTIKPYAYIVAGKLKVPIGWSRNGLEVPYDLLIDELAARCGHEVDFE
ncbi:MAG TPA: hypothetical protein PLH94_08200 [Fimbriimonadaceae bacterium]|nr:hypothetical protein [Fimbriimonadaceae bacterium]